MRGAYAMSVVSLVLFGLFVVVFSFVCSFALAFNVYSKLLTSKLICTMIILAVIVISLYSVIMGGK